MKFATPYETLEEIAPYSSVGHSAAELHGILTGMLCIDERISCAQWIRHAFGEGEEDLASGAVQVLAPLYEETRRLLADQDCGFDLFLPDEDAALSQRTESLADWCQGFLYGLGYGSGDAEWPGDCTELLQDIAEISRLDPEPEPDDTEEAFAELHEFVRVGVQVIHGELNNPPIPPRLH